MNNRAILFSFVNTGDECLDVANFSPHPIRVIIGRPSEETLIVEALSHKYLGPFAPSIYNDENGRVSFTLDQDTNITLRLYQKKPGKDS